MDLPRRPEAEPPRVIADGEGFGGFIAFPSLARSLGPPPISGVLRREAADFRVEEELGFEPEGEGPHDWLLVRKTGSTTPFAARLLAERAGVPVRDVGFSGLKDRHAETTQWFSVPAHPGRPEFEPGRAEEGICILRATRGRKKLRRGVHAGNRFVISIREVRGDREGFGSRGERVAEAGVPSYFGAQRFGRGDGNVEAAARLLAGGAPPSNRQLRGLYLSAARSLLFNRVLHYRVSAGAWDEWVPGDAIVIAGRRRALSPEAPIREGGTPREWVNTLRAHPTGPLWGRGSVNAVVSDALALEREALAGCEGWMSGLEAAGLAADRRALRVVPADFGWTDARDAGVVVRFALPRGAFATAVLRELVRER